MGLHQTFGQQVGDFPVAPHFPQIGLLPGIEGFSGSGLQVAGQGDIGQGLVQQHLQLSQCGSTRLIALGRHHGRLIPASDGTEVTEVVQAGEAGRQCGVGRGVVHAAGIQGLKRAHALERPGKIGFLLHFAGSPMSERLAVLLQYLLPKQALTALAGWLASARGGNVTTALIGWFVRRYQVNMAEAANPELASYATFNDFFTRALQPGARPIATAALVCPVDGAISQFGDMVGGQIFQAKGHQYSSMTLLGGDADLAMQFDDGHFATLYLSPRDYHRIHMPCDGVLRRMIYVPGDLFSVNPATARGVPGLFARNERVVCLFEGSTGPFVLVLVGATIVGSMATVWHGVVNARRSGEIQHWHYNDGGIRLGQGDEMGRFLLGSTVVLLFPKGRLQFNPVWQPGAAIRLGELMAQRSSAN